MNKIKFILTFFLIIGSLSLSAQKINFKKDKVLIDGTECFKYENEGGKLTTIYDLNDDEILSFEYVHVKDYDPQNAAGFNVHFDTYFVKENIRVNLKFNSRKRFFKSLIKSKVLKDCKLNNDKLKSFVNKYSL